MLKSDTLKTYTQAILELVTWNGVIFTVMYLLLKYGLQILYTPLHSDFSYSRYTPDSMTIATDKQVFSL